MGYVMIHSLEVKIEYTQEERNRYHADNGFSAWFVGTIETQMLLCKKSKNCIENR